MNSSLKRLIVFSGYLERTSVLDFVGAASTDVFYSYLSLPDKRIVVLSVFQADCFPLNVFCKIRDLHFGVKHVVEPIPNLNKIFR